MVLSITKDNRIIFVAVIISTIALVIDTSIIKISVLTTSESGSSQRVYSFIVILSITIAIQYLVLGFVREKSKEFRRKADLRINAIHKIVTIVQSILTIILVFIILQISLTSQYNTNLLIAAIAVSYVLSVAMMAFLTMRFFSWFRSNRNYVVLLYGFSSAIFMVNSLIALFFANFILFENLPGQIVPHLGENIPFIAPGSTEAFLNSAYDVLSIMSFMMMWGATSLLLRHYTQRLGIVRYWIILAIPLVFFLSQFLTLYLNLFASLLSSQAVFYGVILTLAFTFSKPAGGILFGIAFWIIARKVQRTSTTVRDYMIISAYGLVIMFTSNQASSLITGPYPPFGLATASFMGLSSYLVLIGIYSSAVSVSEDSKLRQSIRKFAIEEAKILDSIGMAHVQQELSKRVLSFAKNHSYSLMEETGVASSLSEEDMREYMEQVINEVKKQKRPDSNNSNQSDL